MKNKFINKTAFTLIELSISILIISLLMAGFFSMISGSVVKGKIGKTNQELNQIYKALGQYLATNQRLPCPASLNEIYNTSSTFGQEVRPSSGNCGGVNSGVFNNSNLSFGMVPVKTLGLSSDFAIDEFGNKISYIIDQRYTANYQAIPIKNTNSFGTANSDNLLIVNEKQSDGSTNVILNNKVILIILSHGPNGLGSYNINTALQNSITAGYTEDQNNAIVSSTFDNNFTVTSYADDKFDDIMIYKTRADFITDFSMQNLVACFIEDVVDTGGTGNFGTNSVYNGQQLFYNSSCALEVDPGQFKPIKTIKCNSNGQWQWLYQYCE
jgi:prepilin-type N-terminal cleavage/methylation domain-containing protein